MITEVSDEEEGICQVCKQTEPLIEFIEGDTQVCGRCYEEYHANIFTRLREDEKYLEYRKKEHRKAKIIYHIDVWLNEKRWKFKRDRFYKKLLSNKHVEAGLKNSYRLKNNLRYGIKGEPHLYIYTHYEVRGVLDDELIELLKNDMMVTHYIISEWLPA